MRLKDVSDNLSSNNLEESEESPKKYSSDPTERANQLVKEGKIGGVRPGAGRPRKKRASELVAEKAEQHASRIVAAYMNALDPNNNIKAETRLQAAREWLQVERQERELQLKEENRGLESKSPSSLISFILDSLPEDIEGSAVEDDATGAIGPGSEDREGPEAPSGGTSE